MHKDFSIFFSLFIRALRAENETRTRDPQLGKLMLYQLSYFRIERCKYPFFYPF